MASKYWPLRPHADRAMMLCASHALECALKADLAAALTPPAAPSALSEKNLSDLGHDIMALWVEAGARGLALQLPTPAGVEALAALHQSSDHTFPLRYQEGHTRGTDVHGMQYPMVQDVAAELPRLVSMVRDAGNQGRNEEVSQSSDCRQSAMQRLLPLGARAT